MSPEELPPGSLTDEEWLAKLQTELATEDEVEEQQLIHFKTKSVLPSHKREYSTTGL